MSESLRARSDSDKIKTGNWIGKHAYNIFSHGVLVDFRLQNSIELANHRSVR